MIALNMCITHLHMDDLDVPWDKTEGYAFPGMRDPDLAAELGGL
ncbi:hypothetical protein ACIQM3_31805 [Streptomyces sp. NPDC091271]